MRLNIDPQFLSEARFRNFCTLREPDHFRAIGKLVCFWISSQEKELIKASKEEIFKCLEGSQEDRFKDFEALVEAGYLEQEKNGKWRICGNRKHVEAKISLRERASTGGKNSHQNTLNKSDTSERALKRTLKRNCSPAEANSIQCNSLQFNSTQINSIQNNSNQKKEEEKKAPLKKASPPESVSLAKVEKTNELIAVYCTAFKERYGNRPDIDGKTIGLAKNLLRSVPFERASQLVQAYVQMNEPWFKTKCHDFVTFTSNLNSVSVALFNGTDNPQEKSFWDLFWKKIEKEAQDDKRAIPETTA